MKSSEKEETTPSNLGLKLEELRTAKGMSLRELHKKSGVTASYIVRLERGQKRVVSRGIVKALSYALEEDLAEYHMKDLLETYELQSGKKID